MIDALVADDGPGHRMPFPERPRVSGAAGRLAVSGCMLNLTSLATARPSRSLSHCARDRWLRLAFACRGGSSAGAQRLSPMCGPLSRCGARRKNQCRHGGGG